MFWFDWFWFMVFNATFINISVISWWSVLLVKETGVSEENHRFVASHWQTLSHNVVSRTPLHKLDSNTDYTGSFMSIYHIQIAETYKEYIMYLTHRWSNSQRASLEFRRLLVRAPVGSNQGLENLYLLLLRWSRSTKE